MRWWAGAVRAKRGRAREGKTPILVAVETGARKRDTYGMEAVASVNHEA